MADSRKQTTDSKNSLDSPVNEYNDTALHKAVEDLDEKEVNRLLDAGANPNAQNVLKRTPMHTLVNVRLAGDNEKIKKSVNILIALILHKADDTKQDRVGNTPFDFALRLQPQDVWSILIKRASNKDIKESILWNDTKHLDAVLPCCNASQLKDLGKYLLFKYSNFWTFEDNKRNLLFLTLVFKHLTSSLNKEELKEILESKDKNDNSILHCLLKGNSDNIDNIALVLSNFKACSANVDIPNKRGYSPLAFLLDENWVHRFITKSKDFYQKVKLLLEYGSKNEAYHFTDIGKKTILEFIYLKQTQFPEAVIQLCNEHFQKAKLANNLGDSRLTASTSTVFQPPANTASTAASAAKTDVDPVLKKPPHK